MVWYIYIPGTQMTPVLIGKDLVLGGLTFKNRGQLGSRQFHGLDLWVCKCRHISQTFHTWSIYRLWFKYVQITHLTPSCFMGLEYLPTFTMKFKPNV